VIDPIDWTRLADPLNLWLIALAALLGIIASEWIGRFFQPADDDNDPVRWLTVQVAHLAVGMSLAILTPCIWMAFMGEFPDRAAMLVACIAGPASFELCQWLRYRGSGWDKIADTAFMGFPPAGAVLSFQWQSGLNVTGNLGPALLCLILAACVAAIGVWRRA
jgi:hypothetical protein